jgi:F-type H+-transporting ATPase subunit epsilon
MAAPTGGNLKAPLQVSVISPESTIFEGEAESVVVPSWDGELGILRGHAPLMAVLGSGELRIRHGGTVERFTISGGFLQVVDNQVTVLSEAATAD